MQGVLVGDKCDWCGVEPLEAAERNEGPHLTWCVHFREEQRGGYSGLALLSKKNAEIDDLRAVLRQALQQWAMYAEFDDRNLDTEASPEAELYRVSLALADKQ